MGADLLKPNHKKRSKKNREYSHVTIGNMKYTAFSHSDLDHAKNRTATSIKEHLQKRFSSVEDGIYQHMTWIDPAYWKKDSKDELDSIKHFINHFHVPLASTTFDESKVKSEWNKLKMTHGFFYSKHEALEFWQQILNFRRQEYPNISLLAVLVIVIAMSTSVVERGISHLTHIMDKKRFHMKHSLIEDLIIIKANAHTWNANELNNILKDALNLYYSKRRVSKLEDTASSSNALILERRKRKRIDSDKSDRGIFKYIIYWKSLDFLHFYRFEFDFYNFFKNTFHVFEK